VLAFHLLFHLLGGRQMQKEEVFAMLGMKLRLYRTLLFLCEIF